MALFVDGNIIALCNQKLINVNTHVKRGDEILFFVSPEPHYEAQLWEWLSPTANPNLAERTINGKEDAEKKYMHDCLDSAGTIDGNVDKVEECKL
jgi:hypothetical protein